MVSLSSKQTCVQISVIVQRIQQTVALKGYNLGLLTIYFILEKPSLINLSDTQKRTEQVKEAILTLQDKLTKGQ